MERLRLFAAAVAATLALAGCDSVFTASAFSFLQRDPDSMTLGQKVNYAEDALASGDEDAISDAYDAIKEDADSSSDGDLKLLAGQLAMELSGLPDIMTDLLSEDLDFANGLTLENEALLNDLLAAMDDATTTEAAGYYEDAAQAGADMTSTDYFLGALLMMAAAAAGDDITAVPDLDAEAAADLIQGGIVALGLAPGNVSYDILFELEEFLRNEF